MNPVLLQILQAGQLVAIFGPLAFTIAQKMKGIFELDPTKSFEVIVSDLAGQAIAADEATMAEVNLWRTSVGLAPLE